MDTDNNKKKTKKKADGWNFSKGQALLREDVVSGRIPMTMPWEAVYATFFRPEYLVGEDAEDAKRLFEGRLQSARNRHTSHQSRADEEERLMLADRQRHPPPAFDFRGEPRWDGSQAQKIVKQDVDSGFYLGKKPLDYYNMRPQFKQEGFSASTIAGHVKQEEKTKKFLKQYRARHF